MAHDFAADTLLDIGTHGHGDGGGRATTNVAMGGGGCIVIPFFAYRTTGRWGWCWGVCRRGCG